jgi:hypothetical protein
MSSIAFDTTLMTSFTDAEIFVEVGEAVTFTIFIGVFGCSIYTFRTYVNIIYIIRVR